MKHCVLITGTNSVGKSSIAKALIANYGGIAYEDKQVTYLKRGNICLAGRYLNLAYGGVDRITNEKGSSCTSRLADVVEEGLKHADVIVCEGMYLNTFGVNLLNAIFKADRQLILSLYADMTTLYNRIVSRSNGKNGDRKRNWEAIARKQLQAMRSAKKYQEIGVPVLQFNTANTSTELITNSLINKIQNILTNN